MFNRNSVRGKVTEIEYSHPDQILIMETKLLNLLRQFEYAPYRNDHKEGRCEKIIAIRKTYLHDEKRCMTTVRSNLILSKKTKVIPIVSL